MEAGLICSVMLAALTAQASPDEAEFRRPLASESIVWKQPRIVERKPLEAFVWVSNPSESDARAPGPHSREEFVVSIGVRF